MNKLKVMVTVGTRPEIIRLSRVISALERVCNLILVHTGQNYDYELNQIFFDDLEIRKPDIFLNAVGDCALQTIGNIISSMHSVITELHPDALLVLGDTNSCLSVISAKKNKVPIFHMEAGNRCFDMRVPEEINRRIVDHTADVNLPYSSIAREYLVREGLPPDLIIKTGSPMREVLDYYREKIEASLVMNSLELAKNEFFLFSAHREENIDSDFNFQKLINLLNAISEIYKLPIIVSTHPRTMRRFKSFGGSINPLVKLLKPMGFFDYNKLQMNAKVVLSDSGTISEESAILKFPALNLREAHERPEAMEEAAVMMVGLEVNRVLQALSILESYDYEESSSNCVVLDYSDRNVSDKVVKIIHSYVDYVNRVIWKKI